jgi:hypothetical protein
MGRRIFIGDVHGCLGPLKALLEACEFRPGVDVLHPVGDLVNKGPDSAGVVRLMIEHGALPVIGNHDLDWLAKGRLQALDEALYAWLRAQPAVRVFEDVILVHAGLHPKWTVADLEHLDEDDITFATNVRYCSPDGLMPPFDWPPPSSPFEPWDHWYRGDRRVVFGHWARRGLDVGPRAIGLDSGSVYGGSLSAWIAEEDRIVQVRGVHS